MGSSVQVLLIADSDQLASWLTQVLREAGHATLCHRVEDEARARAVLAQHRCDFVVCEAKWRGAPAVLDGLRNGPGAELPVIVLADSFDHIPDRLYWPGVLLCDRKRGVAHLAPAVETALALDRARGERAFEAGQREVLEAIAARVPLLEVLERIVLLIEGRADGMLCSILLLDDERTRMRKGAAPHLPAELSAGIDGAAIGPQAGSCGAAAYLGQEVIVEDIGTHPNWRDYQHLALPHGLRACWSSPILSTNRGQVLGTFAMYYRQARGPTAREKVWVARATHLAAIAILHERAERALRLSEARHRQIVDTANEGVWLLDRQAFTLFANARLGEMLGHPVSDLLGRSLFDFMDESSQALARGDFIQRLCTAREQQQFRFVRKDGSRFWAIMSGSPIRDDKNQSVGALGMLTDITSLKVAERALEQSEAELRVLFESAAIGMALVDARGEAVRTNPALQQSLGYSEAELRQLTISDLAHPEDVAENLELARSLLQGKRDSYQNETRFIRKDGAVLWVRVTASRLRGAGSDSGRVIAMVENVTDRRRMEESVRASERLRTLMYQAVNDVVFYLGVEPGGRFRFLSVNPAFLRATGLEEAAVVGRLVSEVIPEPSLSVVLANYRRAIDERRMVSWDEVSVYPAGVKHGEVSVGPIFDERGACTNLVGTVHDVTENRLAQAQIAAQAALLDKAQDAILVRSLAGVVEYWNQGAERLYGWSRQQAVGRDLAQLTDDQPEVMARAHEQLLASGDWSGDLVQRTQAGKRVIVEARWTLLRDDQGSPRSVLAINTDVTERKRLEGLLARRQRLESLGTLAGGVAHDFNNVLTGMMAELEFAQRVLPSQHPAREHLEQVERASRRAADLVRQMLTFSHQRELRRQPLELRPTIDEALQLVRSANPQVNIETLFQPALPQVLADPTEIHRMVMNLGTNAAQAMRGAGTMRVSVDRVRLDDDRRADMLGLSAGEYVRMTVADSGCGMDEATMEHIFDPFFTTKPNGTGSGLGLSVVHGIVKGHQGSIAVASAPGRGTEFSVYLPAAEAPGGHLALDRASSSTDR